MFLLATSLLLTLTGCDGRGKDDTGGGTDTSDTSDTSDTGDTSDTTDTGSATGFTVSGTLIDLALKVPMDGSALTIAVADPTPALAGGEMEILATGTADATGAFSVAGVETTSSVGLFVVVTGTGVMNSAFGISSASYSGLGDGDVLSGVNAYVVSSDLSDFVNTSISAAGGTEDIVTLGALFGFVFDVAGAPVGGAVASCSGCGTPNFYYADTDPTDGLFSTGATANTSTNAATNAMFVVPGAPIASYTADDGVHDFVSQLGGSLPGFAAFISINSLD